MDPEGKSSSLKGAWDTQPYAYLPLESDRHIRLLKIPNQTDQHFRFLTCSVDEAPSYVALSYTWDAPLDTLESLAEYGDGAPSFPLDFGSSHIAVRKNLREAIEALQPAEDNSLIWIDALCIDQGNAEEVHAQIPLMGEIYSRCNSVIAWLGKDEEGLAEVLSIHFETLGPFLRQIGEGSEIWTDMQSWQLDPTTLNQFLSMTLELQIPEEYWKSYVEFFERRRWFSRAWIMQESAVAPKFFLMCGTVLFEWEPFPLVAKFVRQVFRGYALLKYQTSKPQLIVGGTRALEIYQVREVCRGYRHLANDERLASSFTSDIGASSRSEMLYKFLFFCVCKLRALEATKPHDKIYAVLGIFASIFGDLDPLLKPNYELSAASVYTQTAWILLRELPDLQLLTIVYNVDPRVTASLPSWVPDFAQRTHMNSISNLRREKDLSASGSPNNSNYYRELIGNSLFLNGIEFDKVAHLDNTFDDNTVSGVDIPYLRLMSVLELCLDSSLAVPDGQTAEETLLKTLTTDSKWDGQSEDISLEHFNAFVKYTIAYQETHGSLESELFEKKYSTLHSLITAGWSNLPSRADVSEIAIIMNSAEVKIGEAPGDFYELKIKYETFNKFFGSLAANRRWYRTDRGHLGLGPKSMEIADQVWMICGANVLYVLRPTRKETELLLVGETYVHGYMRGEILTTLGKEHMQRFSLI